MKPAPTAAEIAEARRWAEREVVNRVVRRCDVCSANYLRLMDIDGDRHRSCGGVVITEIRSNSIHASVLISALDAAEARAVDKDAEALVSMEGHSAAIVRAENAEKSATGWKLHAAEQADKCQRLVTRLATAEKERDEARAALAGVAERCRARAAAYGANSAGEALLYAADEFERKAAPRG